MSGSNPFSMPGESALVQSTENAFLQGPNYATAQVIIISTAVDARSSPTSGLLAGLVMGRITASKKYVQYNSAAVDGSQNPLGFLRFSTDMVDKLTGTVSDKEGVLVISALEPIRSADVGGMDAGGKTALKALGFKFDTDY